MADGRNSHQVTISEAFLAGLFAGSVESFVGTPFDILKLRAQLTACSLPLEGAIVSKSYSEAQWKRVHQCFIGLPHSNSNIVSSLRRYPWLQNGSGHPPLVRDVSGLKRVTEVEGLSTLWRGVRPGMFRDATYAGVFFGSWQFLYELLLELKAFKMEPKPRYYFSRNSGSPLVAPQILQNCICACGSPHAKGSARNLSLKKLQYCLMSWWKASHWPYIGIYFQVKT